MMKTKIALALPLAVLTGALALSACGSDDDPAPGGAGGNAGSAGAAGSGAAGSGAAAGTGGGTAGVGGALAGAPFVTRGSEDAKRHGMHEIELSGDGSVANPFETGATVTFMPPGGSGPITVKMFYDGADSWRARAYITSEGPWTWTSKSSDDPALDGKSGAFSAVPSPLRGKLRKHSTNNRQWATDDGQTFLNLSDTGYILFRSPSDSVQPIDDDRFHRYVADAVKLGLSSIRAGGLGGYAGWRREVSGASPSSNRSNWCWEKDYLSNGSNQYWERFDLDRFQTTDSRLEWLLNNHPSVYIQLIMFGKDKSVGSKWFTIPKANRTKTVDYMVARWSGWPQIFYQIVNDTDFDDSATGPENQAMVREIGTHMAGVEPFGTLRSAGAKRRHDSPFILASDFTDWQTYLHIEKYADNEGDSCDKYYVRDYQVPVHLYYGEDWYEQAGQALAAPDYYYRRLFWATLLSDGSPAYGSRYPVLHPYSETGGTPYTFNSTKFTAPLAGLDSVIHIKSFFGSRGIDLSQFEPDDSIAQVLPAPSPEPSGPSRAQVARRGQDEFLVYLPNAKDGERSGGDEFSSQQKSRTDATLDSTKTASVKLDLTGTSGSFQVEWYRASDGVDQNVASVDGGAERTLTAPWAGADVVLRLFKN